MHPMILRQQAVEACRARFEGKAYEPGSRDCAKLAAHALHKQGRKVGLLKGVRYHSEVGALKVLRQLGFETLMDAVDAVGLERIPPASARPGDLVAVPGEGAFGCALMVAADNGRVFGFSDGIGAFWQPLSFVCAWRV